MCRRLRKERCGTEKPHKPYTDAKKMYNVQNTVMLNTFDMHPHACDVNKCVVFYNNWRAWADTGTAVHAREHGGVFINCMAVANLCVLSQRMFVLGYAIVKDDLVCGMIWERSAISKRRCASHLDLMCGSAAARADAPAT